MLAPVSEAEFGERALLRARAGERAPLRGVLRRARGPGLPRGRARWSSRATATRPRRSTAWPSSAAGSGCRSSGCARRRRAGSSRRWRRRSGSRCDIEADHSIDPRKLVAALRARSPASARRARVTGLRVEGERVTGVDDRGRRRVAPTRSSSPRASTSRGSSMPEHARVPVRPGQGPGAAAARPERPRPRRAHDPRRAAPTSSRAATAATCSARRWRSAAGTRRRPRAASTSCCATCRELVPGIFELEIEELIAGPAPGDARQPAGDRPAARSTAWSGPPATTATASCSRRSPPTSSPARSPASRCPDWAAPADPLPLRGGARMKVVLNGEAAELRDGATVEAALESLDLPGAGRGVAVAVDAEVVPRGQWARHDVARRGAGGDPARDPGRLRWPSPTPTPTS